MQKFRVHRSMFVAATAAAALSCVSVPSVSAQEAAGADAPAKRWKTSVAVGLSVTDGNSDTMQTTGSIVSERKTPEHEIRLGVEGAYGEADDERTTDNAKAAAGYKHILSGKAFGLLETSLGYDDIAGVDYRGIVSLGLGYFLIKNDATSLALELGPAYIREKTVEATDGSFALRVAERFEQQLSKTARVWEAAEYLPNTDDFADYLLNVEVGVEAAINAHLNVRLVLQDKYDSTPADDLEKNDISLIGALAVTL